jgi:hypothetical protein
MIAIAKPSPGATTTDSTHAEAAWRDRFADMLPAIRSHVRFAFRHLDVESREEAAQEAIAFAFLAYSRLAQLRKADLAYPSVLAKFAVSRVRSGRSIGHRLNVDDVTSRWCQSRRNFQVDQLDQQDGRGNWKEILVEDHRRAGPAETAAARLDLAAWLRTLPRRHRQIAEALASGETTSAAATLFNVSAARISQVRRQLYEAWQRFQGEGSASPLPNPA